MDYKLPHKMNNFSKLVYKTEVVLMYCQALSIWQQLHRN